MNKELNKIFDVKTREARRRILDKFDISKEDKNEFLNKIENNDCNENIVKYYEVNASVNNNEGLGDLFPIRKGIDPNGNKGVGSFISIGNEIAVAYMPIYFNIDGELKKLMIPEDVNEAGIMNIPDGYIIKEITQEEFYSLETKAPIPSDNTFYIVDEDNAINEELTPNQPYQFEEGMTWEQWLVSDYNTTFNHSSNTIHPDNVILAYGEIAALGIRLNDAKIKWTDVIENTNYTYSIIA